VGHVEFDHQPSLIADQILRADDQPDELSRVAGLSGIMCKGLGVTFTA